MGEVELATVSFGQSFQITPIQLATTVSGIINGGNRITPHLGSAWKVRTEQRCGHWNIRWKAGSCPVRLPGQYVRSWKL